MTQTTLFPEVPELTEEELNAEESPLEEDTLGVPEEQIPLFKKECSCEGGRECTCEDAPCEEYDVTKSGLYKYAQREFEIVGLYKDDVTDYDANIRDNCMELVSAFAEQRHSGYSAEIVINVVARLLKFKPLTVLETPVLDVDCVDVSEHCSKEKGTAYQHNRCFSLFSEDSGKTWYRFDEESMERKLVSFPYIVK